MQRSMLLQFRIIHIGHHLLFRGVMIARVGKEAPEQWCCGIPRLALHDRAVQLVQRVDQNLVLVVDRFHANRKLRIPIQERHTSLMRRGRPGT